MANVGRPEAGEYAPYFERYVSLVPGEDPVTVLEDQAVVVRRTLQGLPEAGAGFRYSPEKWSVREVVGHCADAERVFAYRALAFARGERAALPPFDENGFARLAGHDGVPFAELLDEFAAVRAATLAPAAAPAPGGLEGKGGREREGDLGPGARLRHGRPRRAHHLGILREKYGVSASTPFE